MAQAAAVTATKHKLRGMLGGCGYWSGGRLVNDPCYPPQMASISLRVR